MIINWTKIYKDYKGFWIALRNDEKTVISKGKSAKEAFSRANKKGFEKPILMRIPQKPSLLVG